MELFQKNIRTNRHRKKKLHNDSYFTIDLIKNKIAKITPWNRKNLRQIHSQHKSITQESYQHMQKCLPI